MLTSNHKQDIFEVFFEAAPDALFLCSTDGKIEEANAQAEQLFGYRRDQLIGKTIELLLPDESRSAHVRHRDKFAQDPSVRKMGSELELVGRTSEGKLFPIDVSLSPIQRDGRQLIAAAVRDFSSQREIESALREAKEQAQAATASKSRFLAAASHDLRQPLQSLTLYLAVLRRQSDDPALHETAEKMRLALDNMGELLNALLDLSRFEGGSIAPDVEDFPISILLEQIQADNRPVAEHKNLQFDVDGSSAIIRSDAQLLQRIVENFVTNAIKYTETGSIAIRCNRSANGLAIEVADTGIGIAEAQFESIFDEYMQIDNASRDRRKGLGLGLTIAKNIARLLGHEITVQSSPGQGSVFAVHVPLVSESAGSRAETEVTGSDNVDSISILLVEDDTDVLDATTALLSSIGHEIHAFADAETAIEQIGSQERPDLIVSDFRLPGIDGLGLIKRIREYCGSEIPAIVMTGDTTLPELTDATHPGCAVLFKPIDPDQLIKFISESQKPG